MYRKRWHFCSPACFLIRDRGAVSCFPFFFVLSVAHEKETGANWVSLLGFRMFLGTAYIDENEGARWGWRRRRKCHDSQPGVSAGIKSRRAKALSTSQVSTCVSWKKTLFFRPMKFRFSLSLLRANPPTIRFFGSRVGQRSFFLSFSSHYDPSMKSLYRRKTRFFVFCCGEERGDGILRKKEGKKGNTASVSFLVRYPGTYHTPFLRRRGRSCSVPEKKLFTPGPSLSPPTFAGASPTSSAIIRRARISSPAALSPK